MEKINDDINESHWNIISTLFYYAENGKLDEIELGKYTTRLIAYSLTPDDGKYKQRIKKYKQAVTNFLKRLEVELDKTEQVADSIVATIRKENKRLESLPEFSDTFDSNTTIKFIKSLNKDVYNYSQAAKELKQITRQTLNKNIKEGKFANVKPIIIGKTEYIRKQDLIKIYRVLFPSDNFNF